MKVLHIANDYRDNNLYDNLLTELNHTGEVNQTVYIPFKLPLNLNLNKPYEVISSHCYTELDRINFKRKSNKILNDLKLKVRIKEYDLIHAHTLFSNGYVAFRLNQIYGIPYIISVRGTDVEIFLKRFFWLRNLAKEILQKASKVIFLSPNLKNKVSDILGKREIEWKSAILPNALNDFWLENINESFKPCSPTIQLIQVGWINPNKNQLVTVEAINYLVKKGVAVNLTLVGGSEYKKDYKYLKKVNDYILKNKLEKNVVFTGNLEKEALIDEYRKADIFVLPSKRETFGLVYIEAISQNLPIIFTENQGIDGFYLDKEVGLSTESNDYKKIAENIILLSKNKEKYSCNYEKVRNFSWSYIANKVLNCYKTSLEDFNR